MTRLDLDGPACPHGFPAWRRTRTGEPVCPHCRRAARATGVAPTPRKSTPRQQVLPLGLDVASRAANDRSLDEDDDSTTARVIPISRARRKR